MRTVTAALAFSALAALPAMAQGNSTAQQLQTSTAIAIGGGSADGTVAYRGSYTVQNVPALASLLGSSVNPCALPQGVTGAFAGGGFGVQITTTQERCDNRADAAAWMAMGYPELALRVMLRSPENRDIWEAAGRPMAPSTAPQRPAPVPVTVVPPIVGVPVRTISQANYVARPAWCDAAERRGLQNIAGCGS